MENNNQQSSQEIQPVVPPSHIASSSARSKLLFFIISIVILIIIGAGIFVWKSLFSINLVTDTFIIPTETPSISTSPTTIPTPPTLKDEVTNWKTYINEYYSINYPQNGKIEEFKKDPSIPDLIHTLYINPTIDNPDIQPPAPISIRVWSNLGVEVIDSDSRDKWCSLLQKELIGQLGCSHEVKLKETTVNNYKAFKYTGGRDNMLVDVIYIPHNNYIFQLEIPQTVSTEKGNIRSALPNQILQTFRFTE